MNPVAVTALLVAAMRAEESKRPDRLFEDPLAELLAGEEGRAVLATYRAAAGAFLPIIEVRTRWYDEAISRATQSGLRQFVILAAGMDARAYRLAWPQGSRVFEVDQPEMIAAKEKLLADREARCHRVSVGANLSDDWPKTLITKGFDKDTPTTWLVEGLLQYLDPATVSLLFARVDALSAPGSLALYDVVGLSLLHAPPLAATRQMMSQLGAPWIFGSDQPESLLSAWQAVITDPAVVGNQWKRWPFPAAPSEARGVPRGYFIEARKE